jgi:putative transposase
MDFNQGEQMPFTPKPVKLTESQKTELLVLSRSTKSEHRMVERAKIILLLSEEQPYSTIKAQLDTNDTKISKWKRRFLKKGLEGLQDEPRKGTAAKFTEYDKVRVTQLACSKPEEGYTNWSQNRIGEKLGLSQSTVSRILKSSKLKPHKTEYWCGKSTDLEFEDKMLTIVGLYLAPPDNALVLCVDEKTQIQALDRTQPELPMRAGNPKRLTATYKRHGTVSLIAALSVSTGEVIADTMDKNNSENFLQFLKKLDRLYRHKHLYIIADNLSVHKNDKIKEWLSHKRKITMYFTPTYSSWLNMIEIWFGILTKDVLKGSVWTSKEQLISQLMEYIKTYNKNRSKAFSWTYDPYKLYSA